MIRADFSDFASTAAFLKYGSKALVQRTPAFHVPSATLPFVFVEQPKTHIPSKVGANCFSWWYEGCARCDWAKRRENLKLHVAMLRNRI
jgi:hypothetical protein